MSLSDKIKKQTNISPNSIKVYISNLKNLYRFITGENIEDIDEKHLDKFKDVNKVLKALNKYKDSTIKNYLVAVIIAFKLSDKYDKEIEEYNKHISELQTKVNDYYDENKKSESQKQNWVDYSEILKVLNELKSDVNNKKLLEKEELSTSELDLLQQYLVISLYSGARGIPPLRNDYSNMEIIAEEDIKDHDKGNFFVLRKKGNPYFLINEFKTSKKFGTEKIDISNKILKALIKNWLKYNNTKYFLINPTTKTAMTPNGISKYISKIFKKRRDKTISSSLLRSIYITHKYKENLTTKEKKDLAEEMLHSKNMSENVYHKID